MVNKIILPCLPLTLFLLLSLAILANAQARKPLIYGISEKPFPLISDLEYPLSRAEAWLTALDLAAANLPAPLFTRLRNAGFTTTLARLAMAALLCPLDVVTPQNANSDKIRVFLKWPEDPLLDGLGLLEKPDSLRMEMAFIWETRQAVLALRKLWPASVADGRKSLERMEELAVELDDLWQASIFNSEELTGRAVPWATAFQNNSSAALCIASAIAMLPSSTSALDKALAHLLDREMEDETDAPLWNWLAAKVLFLRGRVQARRDSIALAEADFKDALARLQKTASDSQMIAQTWLNLGRIYKERGEQDKMCAAFEAACAQGECQTLSFARRSHLCLPSPK